AAACAAGCSECGAKPSQTPTAAAAIKSTMPAAIHQEEGAERCEEADMRGTPARIKGGKKRRKRRTFGPCTGSFGRALQARCAPHCHRLPLCPIPCRPPT